MIKWIIGLNGAGKTVLLEEELDKYLTNGAKPVTNIRNVSYDEYDESRIGTLYALDDYDIIFGYGELQFGNRIEVMNSNIKYTNYFLNLLMLLCRKGDTLILDEPETGLFGLEIDFMATILRAILPSYKEVIIATHCQEFLLLKLGDIYWCNGYKLNKLAEGELYEHIGQF